MHTSYISHAFKTASKCWWLLVCIQLEPLSELEPEISVSSTCHTWLIHILEVNFLLDFQTHSSSKTAPLPIIPNSTILEKSSSKYPNCSHLLLSYSTSQVVWFFFFKHKSDQVTSLLKTSAWLPFKYKNLSSFLWLISLRVIQQWPICTSYTLPMLMCSRPSDLPHFLSIPHSPCEFLFH